MRRLTSRSSIQWWIAVSVMALVATIDPSAAPRRPRARVDKAVEAAITRGGQEKVRLIVRTDPSQRKILKELLGKRSGHRVRHESARMSMLAMEVPADQVDDITRLPGMESASIDAPLTATAVAATPAQPVTSALLKATLGVHAADGFTGAGVGIAIVDSGIAPSAEQFTQLLAQGDAQAGAVDLLIRTGGEKRLSDFLLWECAYAELWFSDLMWPDFGRDELAQALADFRRRERRFGGLGPAPIAQQSAAD